MISKKRNCDVFYCKDEMTRIKIYCLQTGYHDVGNAN